MRNLPYNLFSTILTLGLLSSCGGQSGSDTSSGRIRQLETLFPDGSNIEGTYKASFITLNPHVNGTIPGGVSFVRKDDRLYAYVRLFAGGPRVWHQQNVYTGNRCPTLNDDLNKDGYIDIIEAQQVLGNIIIPLDSDVGSQSSGRRFFPLSDLSGSYSYERVTSFNRFFRDLSGVDSDPEDNIIKIPENTGFGFLGKTVMVQGVAEKTVFPETVASSGKFKPFQTLPIVCAVFGKPTETQGSPLTDEIPGPVAPVIEGQDQPAPAGAGEYYPPDPEVEHEEGTNHTSEGETEEGEEGGT